MYFSENEEEIKIVHDKKIKHKKNNNGESEK